MFLQTPATTDAAQAVGGNTNAEAMKQMGFDHLIHNFDFLGWIVFVTCRDVGRVVVLHRCQLPSQRDDPRAHRHASSIAFWDTPSAQDAVRSMEDQPKSEPFSKIALDCRLGRRPSPAP